MKRDMELIREILIMLEEHKHGYAPRSLEIDGYTKEDIGFHVWLMGEHRADLLKVADTSDHSSDSPSALPINITWGGYEFLEAARESSRWTSAIKKITTAGAAMTFDILKGVLVASSKDALGLP